MWKRILDNTLSVGFGIIIGAMIGMATTTVVFKTVINNNQQSYENGYKRGQQECIQLIKNTK